MSYVAQLRRVCQRRDLVLVRRDEFLPDEALVAHLDDRFHDWAVVDLLRVVDFVAAGVAGGVDVADVVLVLTEAADHVAVHDLDVVDVKEDFEPRAADGFDDVNRRVHVIAEVIGVPLHLGRHAGVEVLQAECDPELFGLADDFLQTSDHIPRRVVGREFALEAGERDHAGTAKVLGRGQALAELLVALGVFFLVGEALGKAVAAGDRAGQPVLLERRPMLGINQFDRFEAELRRSRAEFLDRHRIEAPLHDRLANALVGDFEIGWNIRGVGRVAVQGSTGSEERCRLEKLTTWRGVGHCLLLNKGSMLG